MATTKYTHIGFLACGIVAVFFYVLANIQGAIIFFVIGLGFEAASYVMMAQTWRHRRARQLPG